MYNPLFRDVRGWKQWESPAGQYLWIARFNSCTAHSLITVTITKNHCKCSKKQVSYIYYIIGNIILFDILSIKFEFPNFLFYLRIISAESQFRCSVETQKDALTIRWTAIASFRISSKHLWKSLTPLWLSLTFILLFSRSGTDVDKRPPGASSKQGKATASVNFCCCATFAVVLFTYLIVRERFWMLNIWNYKFPYLRIQYDILYQNIWLATTDKNPRRNKGPSRTYSIAKKSGDFC